MCILYGFMSSVSTKQQAAKTKQECAPKADNPPVLDPDPRQGILLISRKQQIHTVLGGTLKYPPTLVPADCTAGRIARRHTRWCHLHRTLHHLWLAGAALHFGADHSGLGN